MPFDNHLAASYILDTRYIGCRFRLTKLKTDKTCTLRQQATISTIRRRNDQSPVRRVYFAMNPLSVLSLSVGS